MFGTAIGVGVQIEAGGWRARFWHTNASRTLMPAPTFAGAPPSSIYRSRYIDEFEAALIAGNWTRVGEYLDAPAAVDYFLGTELTKNPDGYRWEVRGGEVHPLG
jgi:hypothetical protein